MREDESAYNLRPLWDEILKIVVAFDAICQRNGLRYYLCAGTALGAVRHKGFIPWDDDFDVVMPRPDYNRLMEIAEAQLPDGLQVVSRRTDRNYTQPFNKIKIISQGRVESVKVASNLELDEGIYIDIFPLDGAPGSRVGQAWYKFRRLAMRARSLYLANRQARRFPAKYAVHYFLGFVVGIFCWRVRSVAGMMDRMERYCTSFPYDDNGYTGFFFGDVKSFYPPHTFGTGKRVFFDGRIELPLPADYDTHLRMCFGEYMKLPPLEARVPKHQLVFQKK